MLKVNCMKNNHQEKETKIIYCKKSNNVELPGISIEQNNFIQQESDLSPGSRIWNHTEMYGPGSTCHCSSDCNNAFMQNKRINK